MFQRKPEVSSFDPWPRQEKAKNLLDVPYVDKNGDPLADVRFRQDTMPPKMAARLNGTSKHIFPGIAPKGVDHSDCSSNSDSDGPPGKRKKGGKPREEEATYHSMLLKCFNHGGQGPEGSAKQWQRLECLFYSPATAIGCMEITERDVQQMEKVRDKEGRQLWKASTRFGTMCFFGFTPHVERIHTLATQKWDGKTRDNKGKVITCHSWALMVEFEFSGTICGMKSLRVRGSSFLQTFTLIS